MASVSRRCQYALRAVLQLAADGGGKLASTPALESQLGLPDRALEAVMGVLRKAGVVRSRRGRSGGCSLAIAPDRLTVGSIIRLIDGLLVTNDCSACGGSRECAQKDACAFADLWRQSERATMALYDSTTFQDLLDRRGVALD